MNIPPRDNRPLPDFDASHHHQSLKRWERFEQRASLRRRARESEAPPLPCYWREPSGNLITAPAQVLALFQGDLMLVRFTGPLEAEAGTRVLRGGIPWDQWGPFLLRAYRRDAAVPEAFRPRRRLPPDWLEKAEAWRPSDQRLFFERLRAAGLLAPLQKISGEGVSAWMRWEEARERFVDFREAKD
jgi:hypothetical protein